MEALVVKGDFRAKERASEAALRVLGEETLRKSTMGCLYYPYWLFRTDLVAKAALGLCRRYEGVYLMVDGVTGFVGYCVRPDLLREEIEDGRAIKSSVSKDVASESAREYLKKTFPRMKKLAMIKDLQIEVSESIVIYKQFWLIQYGGEDVRRENGKKGGVWVLLDSVSGSTQFVTPSEMGIDVSSAK